MAGQEANMVHREMEKLRRKHDTEVAALQQSLQEARTKPQLCPMCVMAERVKFEFTDVEPEKTARPTSQPKSQYFRTVSAPGLGSRSSWNSMQSCARDDEEESVAGELEDRGQLLENLDLDEFVDEPL